MPAQDIATSADDAASGGANGNANGGASCFTNDATNDATNDSNPTESNKSAKEAPGSKKSRDPLHGMTLEAIVTALQSRYGWQGLSERIPLRCFTSDPSLASSLKLLRKTPWAREKVESLYLFMLRESRRAGAGGAAALAPPAQQTVSSGSKP